MQTRADITERGSALVLVMMITLVLLGLGLMALRASRTEMLSSGHDRTARQAYQVAYAGLLRHAEESNRYPEYFHFAAVRANPTDPAYTFGTGAGEVGMASAPPGVFTVPDPFAGDVTADTTGDTDRLATLEFMTTMSRPRLASPATGFQVAGGQRNRPMFYIYQFDVFGWTNREPGTTGVAVGGGGAQKHLRADVRVGPISAR